MHLIKLLQVSFKQRTFRSCTRGGNNKDQWLPNIYCLLSKSTNWEHISSLMASLLLWLSVKIVAPRWFFNLATAQVQTPYSYSYTKPLFPYIYYLKQKTTMNTKTFYKIIKTRANVYMKQCTRIRHFIMPSSPLFPRKKMHKDSHASRM